jgi:hypothetical protein
MFDYFLLFGAVICGIIMGFLFAKIFFMGRVRTHRQDAIDRSKSVIL